MYHNIHYKYYTYTLTEPHHWQSALFLEPQQVQIKSMWYTHMKQTNFIDSFYDTFIILNTGLEIEPDHNNFYIRVK